MPLNALLRLGVPLLAALLIPLGAAAPSSTAGAAVQEEKGRTFQGHNTRHGKRILSAGDEGPNDKGEERDARSQEVPAPNDVEDVAVPPPGDVRRLRHLSESGDAAAGEGLPSAMRKAEVNDDAPRHNSPEDTKRRLSEDPVNRLSSFLVEPEDVNGPPRLLSTAGGQGIGSSGATVATPLENQRLAKPLHPALGLEGERVGGLPSGADVMKSHPGETPTSLAASTSKPQFAVDGVAPVVQTARESPSGKSMARLSVEENVDQAKAHDDGKYKLRRLAAPGQSVAAEEDEGRVLEENASSAKPGVDVRDVSDDTGGAKTGDPTRRLRESAEAMSDVDRQHISTPGDRGSLSRRSFAEQGTVPKQQSYPLRSSSGDTSVEGESVPAKPPSPAVGDESEGGSRPVSDSVGKETKPGEEKAAPGTVSHTRRLADEGTTSLGETGRAGHSGEVVARLSVEEKGDSAKTRDDGKNKLRRLAAPGQSGATEEDEGRVLEENVSSAKPGVDVRDVIDDTGGAKTGDPTRRLRESAEALSGADHQHISTTGDRGSLSRRSFAEQGTVPKQQSYPLRSSSGDTPVDGDDAPSKSPSPAVGDESEGGSRPVSDSVVKETKPGEEKAASGTV